MLHAFGCSFTRYYWPSWADLLGRTRSVTNWAIPGLGNRGIFTRCYWAVKQGRITDQDRVAVQWSGHTRYDLWRETKWDQWGNVWGRQNTESMSYFLQDHWSDHDAKLQTETWSNCLSDLLTSKGIPFVYMTMTDRARSFLDENQRDSTAVVEWPEHLMTGPGWLSWIRDLRQQQPAIAWPKNPFNDRKPFEDLHPEPRESCQYLCEWLREPLEIGHRELNELNRWGDQAQQLLKTWSRERPHPAEYYQDRKQEMNFVPQDWPVNWVKTGV